MRLPECIFIGEDDDFNLDVISIMINVKRFLFLFRVLMIHCTTSDIPIIYYLRSKLYPYQVLSTTRVVFHDKEDTTIHY